MSHDQSGAPVCAEFSGFDGVDTRKTHSGEPTSADILNFRIGTDGSLEKRYGYRHLLSFPSPPRAFWNGFMEGEEKSFALCDDTVYLADLATGTFRAIDTVGTKEGPADFFFYQNALYLIDGKQLYAVETDKLFGVFGYVPHYIKDRAPGTRGEIHQPLNHLNRFARLSFFAPEENPLPYLLVDHPIGSVDAVYLNGTPLSVDEYDYSSILPSINIRNLQMGDRVVAYVHYDSFPSEKPNLLSSTSAAVFGGVSNSRVFLWDGNQKNIMYASSFVSRLDMKECKNFYSESDPLYFPENYEFCVGDGQYAIRAIARHFDRLLIFTEGDVWMASTSACGAEDFPTMNINSSVTCAVKGGAEILGNDPVSVGKHTLFRWTTETDEKNECNAYSLSVPIDSELDDRFFQNAILFTDKARGELWFHGKDEAGTVWIYSLARGAWFRFTGIHADQFFALGEEVGFLHGAELFCFDPCLATDYDKEGKAHPILASFRSGLLDFGTSALKKLDSFQIRAEESQEVPSVRITADGIGETIFPMGLHPTSANCCEGHTVRRRRLHSGRFRHASLELTAEGSSPLRIHGFTLWAR